MGVNASGRGLFARNHHVSTATADDGGDFVSTFIANELAKVVFDVRHAAWSSGLSHHTRTISSQFNQPMIPCSSRKATFNSFTKTVTERKPNETSDKD